MLQLGQRLRLDLADALADHSVTARSPEGWAGAVAHAARIHARAISSPAFAGEGDHAQHGGGASLPVWERREGACQASAPPQDRIWMMCPHSGCYVLKPLPAASPPLVPSEVEGRMRKIPVLIVAEKNQGGRMVQSILRTADPTLRVKAVTATVGKAERAAPVAMLFEAGKVILHGHFPQLEAELLGMIAGGDYEGPGTSPDRADAMVWGLTELMLGQERAEPRAFKL